MRSRRIAFRSRSGRFPPLHRQRPAYRPGPAERLHDLRQGGRGLSPAFAKGGAKVHLADDGGGTLLSYEVHAQVGEQDRPARRALIDASAKQMADAFFDRFSAQVAPPAVAAAAPASMASAATAASPRSAPPSAIGITALIPREPFGLPVVAWIGGALYLVILILILGSLL